MNMCRFSSREDPGYVQVGGELAELVEHAHQQYLVAQEGLDNEPERKT